MKTKRQIHVPCPLFARIVERYLPFKAAANEETRRRLTLALADFSVNEKSVQALWQALHENQQKMPIIRQDSKSRLSDAETLLDQVREMA
jgi:hypothetical protein